MPGTELAKAYIQILPSAKDFKANLTKAVESDTDAVAKETGAKAGESFGGKLTGALKALVAGAAIKKIGEGIVDTISAGADYQQLTGGVETLFKDSADQVMQYASVAYQTAGLSANEYMETVTGFSAALISSLGGDTAAAAEKANMALVDMSDNANKMGSDMESIQNAYSGFAKQNYTMLDNLKLGYGGTKQEMERLLADAQAISGISYDVSSYGDVVDAIHVIQESMGITGTTALEAGTTVSGSIGQMKSAFENFKISLTDDSVSTSDAIKNMITSVFGDGTENNLGVIGNVIPMVTTVFQSIPEVASTIFDEVVARVDEKIPGFGEKIEGVKTFFGNVKDFVSGEFKDGMVQTWDTVWDAVQTVWDNIGKPVFDGIDYVVTTVKDYFGINMDSIKEFTSNAFSGIQNFWAEHLKPCFEAIGDFIQNILAPAFQWVFEKIILPLVKDVFEKIGHFWDGILKPIFTNIVDFIKNVFSGNWKEAFENLGNIVKKVFEAMIDFVKAPVNTIIKIVNKMIDGLNIGIDALNRFSVKVPDWVPGLGGKTFGFNLGYIGHIPQLANGGVLPKGQMGLLEGTGAEAVVPLDQNERWIREVARDMNRAQMADGSLGKKMDELIAVAKKLSQMQMVLDSGKAVGALSPALDRGLGSREIYSERGLAY